MNIAQMYDVLDEIPGRNIGLDNDQERAIEHGAGPLWIIAGPGSGKTEVLVLRCLKLLCVDLVTPASIMITTFTNKGARSVRDRVAMYKEELQKHDGTLREVDLSRLWIGTLHSLCNDIMQRYRYPRYENVRLLDELEQLLFIYDHSSLAGTVSGGGDLEMWREFEYLVNGWNPVSGGSWDPQREYPPSRWMRARAAVTLFNRIVEDMVDVAAMGRQGGHWAILTEGYEEYRQALDANYRCDFAHLQQRFLDFLDSPTGRVFVQGDSTAEHPRLQHVLVDEYQDTNPIQEAIYMKLGAEGPHSLTVVGDDDQALYRFRGGTVECMVTFAKACHRAWGISSDSVERVALAKNYRSHPKIVQWCDAYIRSFPEMQRTEARSPEKPSLGCCSGIAGDYPSVAALTGRTYPQVAERFADLVRDLVEEGIVHGPEQCALLLKSVRENTKWAGRYSEALRARGLEVYNPRSRTFLQQEEVQAALGAVVEVLDPAGGAQGAVRGRGIQTMVDEWRSAYLDVADECTELAAYVQSARDRIGQMDEGEAILQASSEGPTSMPATLQEVFYHILGFAPFVGWQQDPERTVRLGRLTKVMETYSSIPYPGTGIPTRGFLRTSRTAAGQVSFTWRTHFYYALVGLLVSEQLSDPEDEEVICPPGRVPIMTVHQAKGLEFPFVFVGGLMLPVEPDSTHRLEDALKPFRQSAPLVQFTAEERAVQDLVRFFYVAYSRAQHALVLLLRTGDIESGATALGFLSPEEFRDRVTILGAGEET
jgi:DNA helicase-2/ATP-dependent DNA helicase PcrA